MDMIRIGAVCEVLNGFAFRSENYVDTGIRIIRIANVQKGFIEDNTPAFYPIDSDGINRFMLDEGDLLMSLTGNVGRVAILAKEFLPAALNQRVACLRMKSDKISKRYLFHILNSDFFEKQCIQTSKGVAQKNMSTEWLKEYEIPLYSHTEQREIVDVLDSILAIIEERKLQLQTLDQLIKARFVEMFGGCEELVPAGTIMSEMRNGISPSTSGKHHEKVLTLSAITQGRFDPTMWKDGAFDTEPPTEKRINAYDFYMCRGNGNKNLVGAGAYSAEDRRDLVFPDTVIAARVDTARVCLPYLFVAWMQPDVRDQIETGARTTNGTYKINQQVISRIKIPLPNIAQQKQFASFVSQVDKSKLSIQASLDQLETLKQSLMQEYFI